MDTTVSLSQVFPKIGSAANQDSSAFGARYISPALFTADLNGTFHLLERADILQASAGLQRSPGAGFPRSRIRANNGKYDCKQWAREVPVPLEDLMKYGSENALAKVGEKRAITILLLEREQRVALQVQSAAVPSAQIATGWNTPDSDPTVDVALARQEVFDSTGCDANVMVTNRAVYEALKRNPQIKNSIKLSENDTRWPQLLAALFDVDRFIPAKALVSGANEGQDVVPTEVWPAIAVLARVDDSQDFEAPSFMRTFTLSADLSENEFEVSSYVEQRVKQLVVRAITSTDEVLVLPTAGFRLQGVLTP